jgi:hypothetical protein
MKTLAFVHDHYCFSFGLRLRLIGLIITAQRKALKVIKRSKSFICKMFKANSSHEIDEQNSLDLV